MASPMPLEEQKRQLLSIVNQCTGRSFRVLPERGTTKLLKLFGLDEIERALKALVVDPWHRERIRELSIDYLVRSTTIDKWLQRATSVPKPNTLNDEPLVTI